MMEWQNQLKGDPVNWLLEPDPIGVRDLGEGTSDGTELITARHMAHTNGPIATVLEQMQPEGYWVIPGSGYNPKYTSTV